MKSGASLRSKGRGRSPSRGVRQEKVKSGEASSRGVRQGEIYVPTKPRQGDVVEWWTMQHHPGASYVQRHRATYYADAACGDVLGKDHAGGRPFYDEWLIETWYEPAGSKTSGGRNTTDGLRSYLAIGPASGSVHASWEGARDATIANMRMRAAEFRSMAMDLEQAAIKLAESSPPKGFQ